VSGELNRTQEVSGSNPPSSTDDRASRARIIRALLVGTVSGLSAAYAGATVPLTFGWAITQGPVQAVAVMCALIGALAGWFIPRGRALPFALAAAAMLSFAATVQAIALLYPPSQRG
jgi:hypothetical protein